jgi:hypothetical protein
MDASEKLGSVSGAWEKSEADVTMTGNMAPEPTKYETCHRSLPETARLARQRKAGLASARLWREQGFANLKLARQQRSLNAWRRREEKREREVAEQRPLVVNLNCPCGRIHLAENLSELSADNLRIVHGLVRSRDR